MLFWISLEYLEAVDSVIYQSHNILTYLWYNVFKGRRCSLKVKRHYCYLDTVRITVRNDKRACEPVHTYRNHKKKIEVCMTVIKHTKLTANCILMSCAY